MNLLGHAWRSPRHAAIALIWMYRWTVSPLLGNRCKYHPSCSQYALDALREYGFAKGSILAGWRLLRCNPWSHGGVDYAKDQRIFQRGGTHGSPASPLLLASGEASRDAAPPGQARLRRRIGAAP
jgi:putative membrane protein insertion efficiency factor